MRTELNGFLCTLYIYEYINQDGSIILSCHKIVMKNDLNKSAPNLRTAHYRSSLVLQMQKCYFLITLFIYSFISVTSVNLYLRLDLTALTIFGFGSIRITCPCNIYPFMSHVFIAGYFAPKHRSWALVRAPLCRGGSNMYTQSMF